MRTRASRALVAGALMGLVALVTGVIGPVAIAGAAGKAPLAAADGMRANAPASTSHASAASTEAAAKAAVAKAVAAARAASPGLTREQALSDPALRYTDLRAERPAKAKVDALRATAVKEGAVRVLVTVAARYAPQGILTATELKSQKSSIAALQQKVAAATKPKGAKIIYTYDANIPTIAMLATPAVLDELRADPSVARVEEDGLDHATLEQSGPQVGAADAHDRGFTGSGWTVAVLDTGADTAHPFLRFATVEEACYSTACPGGGTSSTATGAAAPCTYAPLGCRHGTHVSGIAIGLQTADRPLRQGIANGGLLFPIQVFSQFTGTSCANAGEDPCTLSRVSDQIAGLNRVFARRTNHSIAAVNMSIGGGGSTTACDTDTRKAPIDNLRSAGIATVISSGNDGFSNGVSVPGCISTAVTVGAVDKSDVVPNFSNTATLVDVLAPGVSIESSVPGGGYAFFDGTSMAAPHVAGAFAVMKSRTPSLSVDSGEGFLESTGQPITDQGITMPRINVLKAIFQEVEVMTNDQLLDHRNPIPYEHRYQTLTTSNFWSGVAIRPTTGDVDLNVYDFFNYTGLLAGSTAGGSTIDFVVQDSNSGRRAIDNTFPSVKQYTGTGRYSIEYENPVQTLPAVSTITMGSSEIIEMRDSFQSAGVPAYYRVSTTNGGQDPEAFLMESTAGNASTYVQGRASAVASSTTHGVGSDEWFSYSSPAGQYDALVVLNNAGDGDYTLYKDSTAPTGAVTINNGAASTNSRTVTLQLSAADADTGISGMRVSTASAAALANAPWQNFSPTRAATLPATAGSKTVWVQYRNNAFQPSAVLTDTITLNAVIVPGSASLTEGNTGTKVINVPVTLSTPSTQTVTAHWATQNNSAVAPGDYTTASGTVTFTAGQTSKTVPVTIKGDTRDEDNETVIVAFTNPTNAVIGGFGGLGFADITDDDPLPVITPGAVTTAEGASAATHVVNVPLTLSAPSGRTVTAHWATANSTAVAPGDYTAASGTVTFTAGQTSKTVPVTVKGDALDEANEAFFVAFTAPTNATVGGVGHSTATITDDDPTPVITAGVASIAEGDSGTKVINVPVTLSAASGRTVTAHWATANSSAIAPGDYTAASGTVTFAPGQTSKTVAVTIKGDLAVEGNENFFVQFSSPTNATLLGNGRGTATIINDD